jgi:peptide subunit release factor 1 (eRF1)
MPGFIAWHLRCTAVAADGHRTPQEDHDVTASYDDIAAQLARLEHLPSAHPGVVSVYLNTRWSDEHQRDRTRVFLTGELRRARQAGGAEGDDLDWVEREGDMLVAQAELPEAKGVALFACRALGLREVIAVRVPFHERFVVAARPDLGALVELLDEHASAIVAFVDGESARLVALHPGGTGDEVTLEGDVPGRHERGGWAQLAQSRYARHIEVHRGAHFEAVADALTHTVDTERIPRIVLAGHEDRLAAFQAHLPERLRPLVVARIHATRWEPTSAIVERAAERLDLQEHSDEVEDVDAVLTEAAKGGRAVAGPGTLEAARRGAIHRLYILADLRRPGQECERCGALQETGESCWLCGGPAREIELAAAVVDRVQKTGGTVETVLAHAGLAAVGGLAARLRYGL